MITISMGSYNGAKYVGETIDSIINQTFKNWELIVTDDGSTDNTLSILQKYAENDSRIHVIHQENKGPSYARYNGYKMANGEYFIYADDDDVWCPTMLHDMLNLMLEYDVDYVATSSIVCPDDKSITNYNWTSMNIHGSAILYKKKDIIDYWSSLGKIKPTPNFGWGCLFKISFLKSFEKKMEIMKSVLPVHFFDDAYYSYLFITHANSFVYTNKDYILYRLRLNSISHKGNISLYNRYLPYARKYSLDLLDNDEWGKAYNNHIKGFMMTLIRTWYIFEKYGKDDVEYKKIISDINTFYTHYVDIFKKIHYSTLQDILTKMFCLLYKKHKRLLYIIISRFKNW